MTDAKAKEPRLRRSWILFLDLLGTSQAIAASASEGTEQELLRRVYRSLQSAEDAWFGSSPPWAPTSLAAFSDNIVVAWPFDDEGLNAHVEVLSRAASYQTQLIRDGFVARGGLDCGQICIEGTFVFGSGLLEAYRAESTRAVYPRVVLTGRAVDQFRSLSELSAAPQCSFSDQALLRDPEGTVFVDYLTAGLLKYPPEPTAVGHLGISPGYPAYRDAVVLPHRDFVQARLEATRDNERLHAKYGWLAGYHDHVCERLYPRDTDLRVTSDDDLKANRRLQLTSAFSGCS